MDDQPVAGSAYCAFSPSPRHSRRLADAHSSSPFFDLEENEVLTHPPSVSQPDVSAAVDAAMTSVLAALQQHSQSLETLSHAIAPLQNKAAANKKELSESFLQLNDNQVSYNAYLKEWLDTLRDDLRSLEGKVVIQTDLALVVSHLLLPTTERLANLENNFTAAQLQSTSSIVDSIVNTIPVDAARLEKVEKDIQLLNVAMDGLPPRRPRIDDAKKGEDKRDKMEERRDKSEERRTKDSHRPQEAAVDKGKSPASPSNKRTATVAPPTMPPPHASASTTAAPSTSVTPSASASTKR